MMLYLEKLKSFAATYPCENVTVDGAKFRYLLRGNENGKLLVFLNGGMNTLEMWMDYVDKLFDAYRVLLFDYPQELRTNQELVVGMHAFFQKLGVEDPIFVGASDGGMVAQIYTQKYPNEVGGLVLIPTGGMDANTLKILKQKYLFAPLMLWYMKRCNYEKDVHISGLLADLMNQTPVTAADFAALQGKILLILPDQDFFSGKMQEDLIRLMHNPKISYVSGGHLSTVLKADAYIQTIHEFLRTIGA